MSSRSRHEKKRSLKRTAATVPERRTVRIYTEGEATEPEYIDALKRLPEFVNAVSLDISIAEAGASPSTLVEAARRDKQKADLDVDSFWCIFDVESPQPHADLSRAIDMARGNDINLAMSNPCFELWLILHLQSQTGYLTTDEAVRKREDIDKSDRKHLDPSLYMPFRNVARERAAKLRQKHLADGTVQHHDNPSSSMDIFLDRLTAEVEIAKRTTMPLLAAND